MKEAADEAVEHIGETHVLTGDGTAERMFLLCETPVELLQAIRQHEPESMRTTVPIVVCDDTDGHRDLTEPVVLDVSDFTQENLSKHP